MTVEQFTGSNGALSVTKCNVINRGLIRRLSSLLPRRHTKWFAAVEQVGISANNFLFSILIVQFGGIGTLGQYSFWFVMCQFLSMLAVGLCIRQMVLLVANSTVKKQQSTLAANCRIVLNFQILQSAALIFIVWIKPPSESPVIFLLSVIAFTASLNASELFRQYLYMRQRQRLSFVYTAVALSTSFLMFVGLAVSGYVEQIGQMAFWMLALGQAIYVGITISVIPNFYKEVKAAKAIRAEVQKEQLKQGLPLLGGMLVTWLQNKSVTPILMFTMGPLIVGYYALATMIMSPANMVIAGLNKNALPQLRRAYGDGDEPKLLKSIKVHSRTCFTVIAVYLFLAIVVWVIGRSLGYLAIEQVVASMLALVLVTAVLSNLRFWYSQHYVVKMQFDFLFRIGIVAAAITVSIMLFSGLVLKNALFVIAASAIGELCLLFALRRKLKTTVPSV